VLFYKSHIEAAGQPHQNACAQKMKIYKLKLAKNRDFLKIGKMPQQVAFLEVSAFQNGEILYDIVRSISTPIHAGYFDHFYNGNTQQTNFRSIFCHV
jgi:hypothetical protein